MKIEQKIFEQIESLIHQDPGQRGLNPIDRDGAFSLTKGHFEKASRSLFLKARKIAIVTGFNILVNAAPPAPETDGPPGALALARVLRELERDVCLVCDDKNTAVLQELADDFDIPLKTIPASDGEHWCDRFLKDYKPDHLVSIEHPGPSYCPKSIPASFKDRFLAQVDPQHHNRAQNMAGVALGALAPETYHLFEKASKDVVTIGIGDGGNEMGMGALPWTVLAETISGGLGGQIACRIPCQHLIVSGVSNWAAYALCAALMILGHCSIDLLSSHGEKVVLDRLIDKGAIDGVSKENTATVDGLPWASHAHWIEQVLVILREHGVEA
jgi:D-glutamate cyclase